MSYVAARNGRPRLSTYRPRRGLGENYYDLLAQAGLKACDVYDSQCVANNQAKQDAVETYWAAVLATGNTQGAVNPPDFSHITGNLQQFMTNQPLAVPAEIIEAANAVTQAAGVPSVAATVAPPVTVKAAVPTTTTPAGQTITVSNGTATAPGAGTPAVSQPSGIMDWLQQSLIGGIPNWGLVAAGLGAIFIFGGGRGR